ncbi:TniQ family protein [Achromobacter sp. NPDC058515]|uniref:TniQ family protein n=1 Tax=Achromobacter sp. NPDC058515 TaxID=3346533 RepID=UPI0036491147
MTFVVPLPFPDEYVSGHIARIVRLNQFLDYGHLRRHILRQHNDRRSRTFRNGCELIEQQVASPAGSYAESHSMVPLLDLLAVEAVVSEGTDARNRITRPFIFLPGTRAATCPWKLCQFCRQEDIERFDVAYWHRAHQLPGQETCARHGIPLMHFPHATIHEVPNPEESMGEFASSAVLRDESSPVIQRYLRVCAEALRRPQCCRNRNHIWLALRDFGGPLQTRRYELGTHASLTRLVSPLLPRHWMKEHIFRQAEGGVINDRGWTDGLLLLYLCALAPSFEAVWQVLSSGDSTLRRSTETSEAAHTTEPTQA